jgi:vacuolar-type H+-ATPase subunit H
MDKMAHEREQTGRLADLLTCERELAELMAGVREEARRRVAGARDDATRAETELDASLAMEGERARREIDDEARARMRAVLDEAHAQVARFDAVSDSDVAALADVALRRLIGRA